MECEDCDPYARANMTPMHTNCSMGSCMCAAIRLTRGIQLLPILHALLVRCRVDNTVRIGRLINLIAELHLVPTIHVGRQLGPLDGALIMLHSLYSRSGTHKSTITMN